MFTLIHNTINLNSKSMNKYDVIIIGGSYSGLSAAMSLGRASRSILVIDSGKSCNLQTPHSHNFLTQDGETPAAINAKAKEQVKAYPTIEFIEDKASDASKTEDGFSVKTITGTTFAAKKLLFATGIKDLMPDIDGFAACWGKSIIHCPYCHGYEVRGEKTAILANGEAAMHYSRLLLQWTENLTIFTDGSACFSVEERAKLKKHHIEIIEGKVKELKQDNGQLQQIILSDDSRYNFKVMYHRPAFRQHSDIPERMGCTLNEFGYIVTDDMQRSTVPGIFAAGDCATPLRSVSVAVATGMKAGAVINNEMALENF